MRFVIAADIFSLELRDEDEQSVRRVGISKYVMNGHVTCYMIQ